jgi:D-alanyl-D-alanine carboxypeptidase
LGCRLSDMRSPLSAALLCFTVVSSFAKIDAQLTPPAVAEIDKLVDQTLLDTGTPSVSIAVVKDGKIAFVQAYGNARLDPPVQARPDMRYKIGSVSKQFLAGAILLLVQEGKMSIDDRVGMYLPGLTRGADITIRQLLSHTSGYQDYYPLDFVAPFMQEPVTPDEIINRWARKPLDFEPGTQWQYSNTNYVVAGRVLEKVAGTSVMDSLRSRIFGPLGMKTILDLDNQPLAESDAEGYGRFALGPTRPAKPEARGWLFAAGELAMTARDLALWDLSLIEKKLLKPAALETMTSAPRLKNGAPQGYALGVSVGNAGGHPVLAHSGGVSGFTTNNMVWLDQGAAVAVFANKENSSAPGRLSHQIGQLLLKEELDPHAGAALAQAKQIFGDLQQGKIDSSLLTADAVAYFSPQVIADYAASLKPLGVPKSFVQVQYGLRGGFTYRVFEIGFADKTLHLSTYATPAGKPAQYLINE